MAGRPMSDEEFVRLLAQELEDLARNPLWEAPSYEVRAHEVRQLLELGSDAAAEREMRKAFLALARQIVADYLREHGRAALDELKRQSQ